MNGLPSAIPQADPLPLPGPGWLLWFLLTLTFFLHLLPMNFVLGGSLIAAVARLRGGGPAGAHGRKLAGWLASAMPIAIAATVTFGVAPLLFVQALYGRLFFAGSVLMAWFWFAVIPILILAYYGSYLLAFRGERLRKAGTVIAWGVAVFFGVIAFLYSNNMSLMLRPEFFQPKYAQSASGFHLNLGDPTLWPRFLHMLLGAVAVAGMAVAHFGLARRKSDPEFGAWAARHGALWFVIPTAINVIAGAWWLIALPREVLLRFMGGSGYATTVLGLGVVLGLASLVLMAIAIYAPDPAGPARAAGGTLVLTLLTMILARDEVRQGMLERVGFRVNPWVEPQWGPIAVFAVLLLISLGTVIWMVATFARSGASSRGA
jgi:hypothetical protein